MKGKKRLLSLTLILALILSLAACVKAPVGTTADPTTGADASTTVSDDPEHPTEESFAVDMDLTGQWTVPDRNTSITGTFSDAGFYFLAPYQSLRLLFADTENGITVALCSKVGCSHGTAEDLRKEDCEAAISLCNFLHYWDGHIYYNQRVEEDPDGTYLFRRNADGTGEELVTAIGKEYISDKILFYVRQSMVAEGMLYCVAGVSELDEEGATLAETQVLLRVDLETGRQTELVYLPDTYIELVAAREDAVLFYTMDLLPFAEMFDDDVDERLNSLPARLRVWSESGGLATVFQKARRDFTGVMGLQGDQLYYKDWEQTYTFDLAAGSHAPAKLPQNAVLVNGDYMLEVRYSYDNMQGLYSRFLDVRTGEPIVSEFDDADISVRNISDRGCILEIEYLGEWTDPHTVPVEREIFAYVSFEKMADGLQKSDLLILHDEVKDET